MSDDRPLVLVVEDNTMVRELVLGALKGSCRVVSAVDGVEGLARANASIPDLVITDVVMPRMDGVEMIRRFRSSPDLRDTPIMVLTAQDDDILRVRLLEGAVQDFVTKPFVVDEVRARVQNLIDAKRARDLLRAELKSQRGDLLGLAKELTRSRRELEAALEQMQVAKEVAERASLMKSNFLRVMSHELRTPITAMQLSIRLLERDRALLGDRQRQGIERIGRSYQRLLDLVDTVMEYARIESGRVQLRDDSFAAGDLLEQVALEIGAHAEQKALTLQVRAAAGTPTLRTDRHLLRLVVVSLVHHAIRVTTSGPIILAAEHGAGGHRLSVRDGMPMSREEQAQVFDPLGREELHCQSGSGSGLGLAIVRDMVRALGGELEVRIIPQGTLVTVCLPA